LRKIAAALVAIVTLSARASSAQPTPAPASSTDPRDEARELARLGDEAFGIGRCDKAIPLWRNAEAKFHAPTLLLRIARCQALLGKVVDATATLSLVLGEKLPAGASAGFVEAQEQAARELAGVRQRIANLNVRVETDAGAPPPIVEIDGARIEAAKPLPIDPGVHRIVVRVGETVWERSLTLEEGQTTNFRAKVHTELPVERVSTQRYVGYAFVGVGAVSVIVGGILGYTVLQTSSSLDDACGPGRTSCPPERQDDISSLKTRALVSDITLFGGGALLAAGGIVLLTEPKPKDEPARFRIVATGLGGRLQGSF
jgi:hypothetical protein